MRHQDERKEISVHLLTLKSHPTPALRRRRSSCMYTSKIIKLIKKNIFVTFWEKSFKLYLSNNLWQTDRVTNETHHRQQRDLQILIRIQDADADAEGIHIKETMIRAVVFPFILTIIVLSFHRRLRLCKAPQWQHHQLFSIDETTAIMKRRRTIAHHPTEFSVCI